MLIECDQCTRDREVIDTWWWVPDAEKAKLRRRIARHKHEIRFLPQDEYNREMRKQPAPEGIR